jgi:hypothetical protein
VTTRYTAEDIRVVDNEAPGGRESVIRCATPELTARVAALLNGPEDNGTAKPTAKRAPRRSTS